MKASPRRFTPAAAFFETGDPAPVTLREAAYLD
jgi:hypothetical protein